MKNKIKKFVRFLRKQGYQYILVVFLVVFTLPIQACAAIQTGLPAVQNSGAVTTTVITAKELATGMQQDETFIMFCARTNTYLVSYLTETGRVFVFYTARAFMSRGLMVGLNRTADMITQFLRDGWQYIPGSTAALNALMRIPMPTIMIFPVLPGMDLNTLMHQNDVID